MDENKIVHFWEYCEKCEFYSCRSTDEPCNTCLDNPANVNSRKPINFKENENLKGD